MDVCWGVYMRARQKAKHMLFPISTAQRKEADQIFGKIQYYTIWKDVLSKEERGGVVRRPAIACGHLPLFPKPSPNNSHQDSRHNWKSTNHYNVSQVFWHSANIQAAWLQDSFPSCELISSTQTSKWGRRIPCNASVISYRKTALNIFFIKVFAHETIYMLRGWMCQEPGLSWRSLWKKSSLVSEHSAPISWFLWTGNKRENEGKCRLICIHELGRNQLMPYRMSYNTTD